MHTLLFILLLQSPAHLSYRQLTFSDFRGHGSEPGLTVSNIDLIDNDTDGITTYRVEAYFSPKESYINLRTAAVLQHEQGHLDITEIYARRLRAFLSQHLKCNHQQQVVVSNYYDQLIADWSAEENLYDKETDHSREKEQQAAWLKKIASEMAQ